MLMLNVSTMREVSLASVKQDLEEPEFYAQVTHCYVPFRSQLTSE